MEPKKIKISIFLVLHIEISAQRETSSHPYYQIFCGRIPWSIPFPTHVQPNSYDTWGFFFRGWTLRNFFKVTLMSLFEIQNVFMIIKNDVLDRLGHGWDVFNTIASPKLIFHYQILADLCPNMVDFGRFKAFISNFLYYNLYQRKLKVITQP